MTKPNNSNPNLYALLIGIDCYLPNRLSNGVSYRNLGGSVRDINHVEEFLLRQPLKPTQIFKLTSSNPDFTELGEFPEPKEPKSQLPTYKNIVAKFQELTETAASGDLVYIQYSGHGGRAITNYPQIKGDNGIDEGFVPVDIGTGEGQYLRDLELAMLMKKMVDKGLVVTLVIDCCHSGGTVRGEYADIRGLDTIDETERPVSNLVSSTEELTQHWQSLTQGESDKSGVVHRKGTAVAGMLPEVEGYVVLAACRPSEYAFEYAFDSKNRNGALTYWLLDTLNQLMPGMTYKILHDRINAKIKTLFPQQSPMLIGEAERLVFGSEYVRTEYAVNIMQVKVEGSNTKVKFDAGQAQGLRKGTEFAIYSFGSGIQEVEERIAIAQITELGASDSWAEITNILNDKSVIEQGAQAVLTSAPVKLVKKVRLLKDENQDNQNNNIALQAVESALIGNGWLELAQEDEAADFIIDTDELNYQISDRTGLPIVLRPLLKVNEFDSAEILVKRLVHLAKYQSIQELDNHDANSPLRGKIAVELLGTQADYDSADLPDIKAFTDPSQPEVKSEEYFFFKIRNNYSDVVNVAVLNLQSNWKIRQVYPINTQFISLDPGGEETAILTMSLPSEEQIGEDIFKVFATVGTANFRWLELPPLDQPILPPEARGVSRSGGALDEFLMTFAAEQPPTRNGNPVAFPSREWTTTQFGVKVKGNAENKQVKSINPINNQNQEPSSNSTIPSHPSPSHSYSANKMTKILTLAANPKGDLRLSQEIRDIREGLQRSKHREQFKLEQKGAVRPQDLQPALLEVQPRIVHFCGHGSGKQGLVFENNAGEQQLVSTEALADLFKLIQNTVECVLLNACYSHEQAEAIGQHINYVIGMQQSVKDDVAIAFTVGFYEALGSGETIESAYEWGRNRIQLEFNRIGNFRTNKLVPIPEHLNPVLLKNPNPVVISNPVEEKPETPSSGNHQNNNSGIQQTVSGSTVQGGMQASIGNNNQQSMQIGNNKWDEKQLTTEEIIQKLEQVEQLILAAELLEDVKKKSLRCLEAAKDAVLEVKPDKNFATTNLKKMVDTLKNGGEAASSRNKLLNSILSVLEQIFTYLG